LTNICNIIIRTLFKKGGASKVNILKLDEQIEDLRRILNEAVSSKKTLNENEILEWSQELDKLIIKYYNEVHKNKGLKKAII